LLLERGALQITDFGFANRFEHATNDLMATSCGSPCYAAPELVVQEGKYVGTAVDVWSCGVILYAMLAGYLPYDDDPANPEGDNINLLYKYIINTQLSFPDWITAEPRSLLLMMLVPNPEHRCTIEDVTRHSWLRKYASTFSNSVEELETQAQEAEMAKRQALEAQRQFLMQQQAMQSQVAAGGMSASEAMTRSQSNNAAQKHRSAIVTSSTPQYTVVVPPSVPEESPSGRARTVVLPYQHSSRRSGIVAPNSPTIQSHPVSVDVDSFSYDARRLSSGASSVPMSFAASAPSIAPVDHIMADAEVPPTPSRTSRRSSTQQASAISTAAAVAAEVEKRKKSHRATVQLEYDGGAAIARTPDAIPLPASPVPLEETSIDMVIDEAPASHVEPSIAEEIPTAAPVELCTSLSLRLSRTALTISSAEAALATAAVTTAIAVAIPTPSSPLPSVAAVPFPSTPPRTPSSPAGSTRARLASSDVPPVPVLPTSEAPIVDANVTPKGSRKTSTTSHATVTGVSSPRPPSAASSALSKHGKSASSSDRFSLRAFLPGATTKVSTTDRAKAAEVRREADAVAKEKVLEEVTNRRQSRRQKALSLQPFRQSTTKVAKVTKVEPTVVTGVQTRSSTAATTGSMGPPPKPSVPVRPLSTRASTATTFDTDSSSQAPGTPSGKARAVMDWFRRRSTRGVPVAEAPRTAIATDFDRYRPAITHARPPSDAGTAMQEAPVAPSPSIPKAPAVVVTSAVIPTAPSYPAGTDRSEPSSRSASGAQSHLSQLTTSTMATTASRGSLIPTAQAVFSDSKLRIHQGALDRAAVTSRLPPVIIVEVRNALWNMGIDVFQEGEFSTSPPRPLSC
jgi:protein-serine/threonine kinase